LRFENQRMWDLGKEKKKISWDKWDGEERTRRVNIFC
jgi:hypothetical protein